ncbi:MAG: phosphoribosyl-ATP diphosphatase [Planctomycetes bacterium]|nr:phosphoribosyl-ATP diphosphatase [Planctomycetota bacterium]
MDSNETPMLNRLAAVIEDRKRNPSDRSYTARLLNGGTPSIGAKVMEEAGEVVEAAHEDGDAGRAHLAEESADLVYHLLVLLAHRGLTFSDVERVLARRFGVSGIDEKESRGNG